MNDVMIYVLKSVFVLLLLYVPYTLLLRKEKFFRMNRITLIAILVLSLVVPFCNFPSLYWADGIADAIPVESDGSRYINELMYRVERPSEREGIIRVTEQVGEEEPKAKHESSVPLNQSSVSQPESGVVQTSKTGLGMMELLAYIYIIGVGVAIVFRLWQFVRMERLMRHGCLWKDTQEGITVYCKTQDITPYSWMNSIVISQKDYETHRREILLHEKGHVICRHSLDILLLTVVQTLQWFNPFVYMFGSSLRDIHEYEADDYVLRQGVSADAYQNLLLKAAIGSSSYTFANSFNHSLIKNRIIMMKEEQKSSWMRCKVLYILPLTFVALCVFASPRSSRTVVMDNPATIWQNVENTRISSVELTDTSTFVRMKSKSVKKTWIRISSATCIYDEKGRAYKLKGGIGITPDSLLWIAENGTVDFTLLFTPIPKNTKAFDLMEGKTVFGGFRFIGIHDKKNESDIKRHRTRTVPNTTSPSIEYDKDTTYIYGKLNGYKAEWGIDSIYNYHHRLFCGMEVGKNNTYACTKIDTDGSFCIKLVVDAPVWTFFRSDNGYGVKIPFYAYPGDVMHIEIDDFLSETRKVTYKSEKGYDMHANLMMAGDMLPEVYFSSYHASMSYNEFMDKSEKFRKEQIEAVEYLSGKYGLTPFEERLLANRASSIYGTLLLINVEEERYRDEEKTKTSSKDYYDFLKDLPLDDDALLVDPACLDFFIGKLYISNLYRELLPFDFTYDEACRRFEPYMKNDKKPLFILQALLVHDIITGKKYNKETLESINKHLVNPYLKKKFDEFAK